MGFKEEFLKLPPGSQREDLVYQYAIKIGPPKTVPLTVNGPNNTKITYYVMPDYLMIDGIRAPMTASTAQKIANHYGMQLPNAALAKEIYNQAKQKGNAISAKPLSGRGAIVPVMDPTTGKPKRDVNGKIITKHYSGEDVVQMGVNKSEWAIAYNDSLNREQALKNQDPKNPEIVSGHFKDILAPVPGHENRMALYGLFDSNGKPIQGGNGLTPHDTTAHSEYAAAPRLISEKITITLADGRKIDTTAEALKKRPELAKSVPYIPGLHQYGIKPSQNKPAKPISPALPAKPSDIPAKQPIKPLQEPSLFQRFMQALKSFVG